MLLILASHVNKFRRAYVIASKEIESSCSPHIMFASQLVLKLETSVYTICNCYPDEISRIDLTFKFAIG